jgi:hypothetical protein
MMAFPTSVTGHILSSDMIGSSLRRQLAWIFSAFALAGCAGIAPQAESGPVESGVMAWQRVRFRLHWDRASAPRWHADALLAHRVVGPVMDRERATLRLWRFHRRAADDAAGHAFSTLTYAAPATNARICLSFQSDPLVTQMIRSGLLDRVECEGFGAEKGQMVEATSDPRWSPELQRSWPYFIMGASEAWLRLIDEHARRTLRAGEPVQLGQALDLYEGIDRAVTRTWQQEGRHAFLHHLNALFGYAPIDVGDPSPRRF